MTATDQLANKLLEIINQVQSTVTNHGADAVNLILMSIRIEGIIYFIVSLLPLCFMGCFFIHNMKLYFKVKRNDFEKFKKDKFSMQIDIFAPLIVGIIPIILIAVFSPFTLIQPFSPKLYLAHEIIQKVIQ